MYIYIYIYIYIHIRRKASKLIDDELEPEPDCDSEW